MTKQWVTGHNPYVRSLAQPIVMVVADHEKVRGALIDWLNATFPGCQVQETVSGEEALVEMATQPVDVALIAMHLPHMSGIEATRRLRTLSPRTRVVLISFFEEACYRVDAESAGASAFVSMRTLPKALAPIMANLLATPAGVRAENELTLKFH